jgi:hypothetical protein
MTAIIASLTPFYIVRYGRWLSDPDSLALQVLAYVVLLTLHDSNGIWKDR